MNKHIKKILKLKVEDAVFSQEEINTCINLSEDKLADALHLILYNMKKISVISEMKISEFDFLKFMRTICSSKYFKDKSLAKFIEEDNFSKAIYQEIDYTLKTISQQNISIKKNYNIILNQIVISVLFSNFIDDISKFSKKLHNLSNQDIKKELIKLIAFFYNYNMIDISFNIEDIETAKLVNQIKNNCYEIKVISSSYKERTNPNKQSVESIFDISNLINNCMKETKYVYREPELKGKHLSHKNPIPHIRKGHHTTLRNGKRTYIKTVLVNAEEANPLLIEKFQRIIKYEEMYLKKIIIEKKSNTTYYTNYMNSQEVA